jgi:Na+-transporting NADH:ubiquinone oxidoreductase subunit C
MAEESIFRPFYTVLVLAFACSALVAGAAVGLRPLQEVNRQIDQKKHILFAAGLFEQGRTVDEMFAPIETRVVELASGQFVGEDVVDPATYRQLQAAFQEGKALSGDEDPAKIRHLEKYSLVYLVQQGDRTDQIILPVRGKGLWSTMYAYVALDGDLSTVRGVSFYEHGETPGLGGEIENQRWLAGWQGKKIYNPEGEVELAVVKGNAADEPPAAEYQVDGISGATLTIQGVNNLMEFWFGEHGFKPLIAQLQNKDRTNG